MNRIIIKNITLSLFLFIMLTIDFLSYYLLIKLNVILPFSIVDFSTVFFILILFSCYNPKPFISRLSEFKRFLFSFIFLSFINIFFFKTIF